MRLGLREGAGVREVAIVVVGWLVAMGNPQLSKGKYSNREGRVILNNFSAKVREIFPRPPNRGRPERGVGSDAQGSGT